ncbi:transposase [Fulvitalea axinellae]|uniref:transposase n=1 Tax=Fulvitalea axinellae TaxID=1182444 RepID=UPI0030CA1560
MDSGFVFECVDDFCERLEKLTVLVLDNAPWHKSEQKERWRERGLYLFFLPPYSPQLNLVEILWNKIKYEWLELKDYATSKTLKDAIVSIVNGFMTAYCILVDDPIR